MDEITFFKNQLNALGNQFVPQTIIPPLEPTVVISDFISTEVISTKFSGIPEENLLPQGLVFGNPIDSASNSTKNTNSVTSTTQITPVNVLKKRQYPQRLPKSAKSPNPLLTSTLHTHTHYLSTLNCVPQPVIPIIPTPSSSGAAHRGKRKKKKIRKV